MESSVQQTPLHMFKYINHTEHFYENNIVIIELQ